MANVARTWSGNALIGAALWILASLLAVSAEAARAAPSLGPIKVVSEPGQPLRAEAELRGVARGAAAPVEAAIAKPDIYKKMYLDYPSDLGVMTIRVKRESDGRTMLQIESQQPLNTPVVDVLIDVVWPGGKLSREFGVMTDTRDRPTTQPLSSVGGPNAAVTAAAPGLAPPGEAAAPPAVVAPVTAAAPVTAPVQAQAAEESRARAGAEAGGATPPTATATRADRDEAVTADDARRDRSSARQRAFGRAAAPSVQAGAVRGDRRVVARGETLNGIVAQSGYDDALRGQALIAIYRANRQAFFGSVHQLRAGAELAMPDEAAVAAVDAAEARRELRRQLAHFRQLRDHIAANPRRMPAGATGSGASDSAAAAAGGDRLQLSKAGEGQRGKVAGGVDEAAPRIGRVQERTIAIQAALSEANSRAGELERNITDLRQLLELKDRQLADLSQRAQSVAKPAENAAKPDGMAAMPGMGGKSEPAPAAATPAPSVKPAASPAPARQVSPTPPAAPAVPSETDGFPWTYAAAGVGVLLLVAAAIWLRRRRAASEQEEFDAPEDIETLSETVPASEIRRNRQFSEPVSATR